MTFFMHKAEDDLNSSAQEIEQLQADELNERDSDYWEGGVTMVNDPTNEDEIEEAREMYELKKLMRKHAGKVVGLLKELNEEHIKNVQELENPTFKVTRVGG